MLKLRALALHLASWEEVVERASKLLEALKRECRRLGIEPWSFRVVLPLLPREIGCEECLELARALSGLDALVALPMEADHPCASMLVEVLRGSKVFIGVSTASAREVERILELLRSSKLAPEHYARVAVAAGDLPETPYFPATRSVREGLSVALQYVSEALQSLGRGGLRALAREVSEVERAVRRVALGTGLDYLGVDLSLSPWMEDSVARVVEALLGGPVGSPGTLWAIRALNTMIEELAEESGVKSIGFGEVMMAVAEDSLLNARVGEGLVRLRDLVAYSVACAVGVDMVAVPRSLDVRGFARDLWTVYEVKSRPVSARLLFADASPGTAIYVEEFGATFVAKI